MEKEKKPTSEKQESKKEIEEKGRIFEPLKKLGKKTWYQQHLPWPDRLIRKPNIKFGLPKAPKIPVPSRELIFFAFLGVFSVLIAGFLYDITRNTVPLNYKQEDQTKRVIPQFFWPDLHESYIIEGVVASIIVLIGVFGLLFIYQSTKNFYRPKSAYSYLVAGTALIILSFIILEWFISQKGVKLYSSS